MALEQNSGGPSNVTLDSEDSAMPSPRRIKVEEVDVTVKTHRLVHHQDNQYAEKEERLYRRRNSRSRSPRQHRKTSIPSRRRHDD